MTSPVLARLERQMKLKREPAPPPSADHSALSEAIAQLIQESARAGAEEAVRQQPAPRPAQRPQTIQEEFDAPPPSSEFPPPTATTKPPRDMTMLIQRDELGRIKTFTVGNDAKFELQRDGRGRTVRVVQLD